MGLNPTMLHFFRLIIEFYLLASQEELSMRAPRMQCCSGLIVLGFTHNKLVVLGDLQGHSQQCLGDHLVQGIGCWLYATLTSILPLQLLLPPLKITLLLSGNFTFLKLIRYVIRKVGTFWGNIKHLWMKLFKYICIFKIDFHRIIMYIWWVNFKQLMNWSEELFFFKKDVCSE